MRVGFATDFYYPWIGGPSSAIRSLAEGLHARGHDVFLLAPSPDGVPRIEDGPIEITRLRTLPTPFGYNVRTALPPLGVGRWIGRTRPDIINIHHPFPISTAALVGARRRGIPVLATNHTIPSCSLWGLRDTGPLYSAAHWILARWIVSILQAADAAATPTQTAAQLIRELGYDRHISVISNGIDTERFSPGAPSPALRQRLGLDERPLVLYTGRLDAEKNMEMWLRAAAHLAQRHDVQFVVGGEGTERRRLEAHALSSGLSGCVRFVGYVDRHDLPDLYRLADVYFITSPVELQSITTLEAVASGLPVVAVDAAALPELVKPGRNGYLVMRDDAHGAAQALGALIQDRKGREAMGRASRSIALRHAVERSIDAYERLLETAIDAQRGDRRVEPAGLRGT